MFAHSHHVHIIRLLVMLILIQLYLGDSIHIYGAIAGAYICLVELQKRNRLVFIL